MTRLIDADALIESASEHYFVQHALRAQTDKAPTVNAIPVEWITKYVNASGTSSIEQDIIREMVLAWICEREDDE